MDAALLLKRFDAFAKDISATDRVGLMVHSDADGIMSAAVAATAVKALSGKYPVAFLSAKYVSHAALQKKIDFFADKKVNKVLVLDLSLDQDDFLVKGLESFAHVLFVDHHKIYNDFNSEKTVFLKASWIKPELDSVRYPASKFAYDLFSRVCAVSDADWMAAVGLFGDCAVPYWKDFFEQTLARRSATMEDIKACAKIIDAVGILAPDRFEELYKFILTSKNPRAVADSAFGQLVSDLDAEMNYWLSEFKSKAEIRPDIGLVWFVYTPRFPVNSPLINHISFELYPQYTVILVQLLDGLDTANFSARHQNGKRRVNDLLEKSVASIEGGSAGGHAPAAAGKVPRDALDVFKENIVRALSAEKNS